MVPSLNLKREKEKGSLFLAFFVQMVGNHIYTKPFHVNDVTVFTLGSRLSSGRRRSGHALRYLKVVGRFIHSAQYVIALLVAFSFTWMPLLISTSKNVSFHKLYVGYARLDFSPR